MLQTFINHSLHNKTQLLTKLKSFSFSSGVPSAGIRAELEAEIKANPIVIYSKTYCPYCK